MALLCCQQVFAPATQHTTVENVFLWQGEFHHTCPVVITPTAIVLCTSLRVTFTSQCGKCCISLQPRTRYWLLVSGRTGLALARTGDLNPSSRLPSSASLRRSWRRHLLPSLNDLSNTYPLEMNIFPCHEF